MANLIICLSKKGGEGWGGEHGGVGGWGFFFLQSDINNEPIYCIKL